MFSALFEENSSRFCKSVWWHCSYCALGVCYDDNFSVTKDGWLCSQIVTLPVSIFLSLQAIVYSSRMIRVGLGKWLYTKPRWGMSRHLGTKRNVQISKVKWSVLILGQCESIFEKRPEKKNVFLLEFWNSAVSLQPPFMSVKSCSHSIFPLCHLPSVLSPLCAVFPLCHLPSVSSPTDFVSLHAGYLRMDPGLSSLLCLVWMAALPGGCPCGPPHCDGGQPELQCSLLRALPKILCNVQWSHPPLCCCPVSENCSTCKAKYKVLLHICKHSQAIITSTLCCLQYAVQWSHPRAGCLGPRLAVQRRYSIAPVLDSPHNTD